MRFIVAAMAFLVLGTGLWAEGVEVAWVRILSGDSEPVAWRRGERWPARPDGFPFAPSAVLSYATLRPGDSIEEAELRAKVDRWARELEDSRRFSRSAVLVAELDGEPEMRGVIVEVEPSYMPLFDGGAAYAQIDLPLFGGRRGDLAFQAGPNLASAAFRDEALGDRPIVLDSRLAYANDLLDSGNFSGNRLEAALALGPRLGPLGSLLLRARTRLSLDDGAPAPLLAIEPILDLAALSLLGVRRLDGSLSLRGDAYAGQTSLRCDASSDLRFGAESWSIALVVGAGLSSGSLDEREAFDLGQGEGLLLGPALPGGPNRGSGTAGDFALARLDGECLPFDLPIASWFKVSLGPFAFCEAVSTPGFGDRMGALGGLFSGIAGDAGGGIRVRLGLPIGVTADLGYALSDRGVGSWLFYVHPFDTNLGKELR